MSPKKDLKAAMGPRRTEGKPVADTFVAGPAEPATASTTSEKTASQTSVRLPYDLHRRARYYSIDTGQSLNSLIIAALEHELDARGA